MYILQVLVVLFVFVRVPCSIHPGRLRSSQSDRGKRRDETSSARACKLCRPVSPDLAPVVQKVDSAIQRINLYPLESAIGFPNTYPLDSDLSGG